MKNKLKIKMLMITVTPLLLLAVVLMIVSYNSINNTLVERASEDMEKQCKLMSQMYDRIYPGDYKIEVPSESRYVLYKGEYDITSQFDTLDNLKEAYDDEFTIFCSDESVLTTLKYEDGTRMLLCQVSAIINDDVIVKKDSKFYSGVMMNDEEYFAYFEPILNEDGTCFGMYGVYRKASELKNQIYKTMMPIVLIYIVVTVLVGIICVIYTQKLVDRIQILKKFMTGLTAGKFNQDMPATYTNGEDELYELAKIGKNMQSSLRLLVECDELTKLNNRRYGAQNLEKIMIKSENNGTNFCVAIGDIDFFKKVNDTYGHDAGDEVLKGVSKILKKNMVGKGFVARWGGEEFLFVFEMIDLSEAKFILENISNEVRALEITNNGTIIKVTMSFGIVKGSVDINLDENVKLADERLYYAKENGRNQICE